MHSHTNERAQGILEDALAHGRFGEVGEQDMVVQVRARACDVAALPLPPRPALRRPTPPTPPYTQLFDELAVVKAGRVVAMISMAGCERVAATITSVAPLAIEPGFAGACVRACVRAWVGGWVGGWERSSKAACACAPTVRCAGTFLLEGTNIAGPRDLAMCRQHGLNLTVEVHATSAGGWVGGVGGRTGACPPPR